MEATSIRLPDKVKQAVDQAEEPSSDIIRKAVTEHVTGKVIGRCAATGDVLFTTSDFVTVSTGTPAANILNVTEELETFDLKDEIYSNIAEKFASETDVTSEVELTYLNSIGEVIYTAERLYLEDVNANTIDYDQWVKELLNDSDTQSKATLITSLLLWCDDTNPDHQLVSCASIWDAISKPVKNEVGDSKIPQIADILRDIGAEFYEETTPTNKTIANRQYDDQTPPRTSTDQTTSQTEQINFDIESFIKTLTLSFEQHREQHQDILEARHIAIDEVINFEEYSMPQAVYYIESLLHRQPIKPYYFDHIVEDTQNASLKMSYKGESNVLKEPRLLFFVTLKNIARGYLSSKYMTDEEKEEVEWITTPEQFQDRITLNDPNSLATEFDELLADWLPDDLDYTTTTNVTEDRRLDMIDSFRENYTSECQNWNYTKRALFIEYILNGDAIVAEHNDISVDIPSEQMTETDEGIEAFFDRTEYWTFDGVIRAITSTNT